MLIARESRGERRRDPDRRTRSTRCWLQGPIRVETIYTIEAGPRLPRITAVRLEALPDPSLPKGGPGRDLYGNFQVNGVEIEAEPVGPKPSGLVSVGFKADQVR